MTNKIQEQMRLSDENFDGAFMNNGVDGLLPDKFQDAKMLIMKKFHLRSRENSLRAVITEIEVLEKIEKTPNNQFENGYSIALRSIKTLLTKSLEG